MFTSCTLTFTSRTLPAYCMHLPYLITRTPMSLFLIFGLVFMHYSLHLPYYSCTLLLLFFSTLIFLLLVFFLFFSKKGENENILNYKKLQKIEKFKKRKVFFFALLCLSGRPHRVTLIFKNTKNTFLSLLMSVRPLALYDTYFQVIQKKNTKRIQNFQNIKISTF